MSAGYVVVVHADQWSQVNDSVAASGESTNRERGGAGMEVLTLVAARRVGIADGEVGDAFGSR